jgi:hypothetical protein
MAKSEDDNIFFSSFPSLKCGDNFLTLEKITISFSKFQKQDMASLKCSGNFQY